MRVILALLLIFPFAEAQVLRPQGLPNIPGRPGQPAQMPLPPIKVPAPGPKEEMIYTITRPLDTAQLKGEISWTATRSIEPGDLIETPNGLVKNEYLRFAIGIKLSIEKLNGKKISPKETAKWTLVSSLKTFCLRRAGQQDSSTEMAENERALVETPIGQGKFIEKAFYLRYIRPPVFRMDKFVDDGRLNYLEELQSIMALELDRGAERIPVGNLRLVCRPTAITISREPDSQ